MGLFSKVKAKLPKLPKLPNLPAGIKLRQWDGQDMKAVEEARKKISLARVSLNQKMPFFGRMTLLLEVQESALTPTMGTDGEYLFFNPYFVTETLTQEQLEAVILHEVLHCALLHLWRKEKRHQQKWNLACDYAINPIVQEQGLNLPPGVLYDSNYKNLPAEKIYDMIKTKSIKIPSDWFSDKSRWGKEKRDSQDGKGKGQGQDGKDKQQGGGDEKDKKQGGKGSQNQSNGGKGQKQGKDQSNGGKGSKNGKSGKQGSNDADGMKNKWGKQHKDLMDKLKGKDHKGMGGQKLKDYWEGVFENTMRSSSIGKLPGYLQRLWKELQPKKDWKKVLQNYLSNSIDDFNFSVPDRRFLEADFYLPDIQSEEKLEDVVIAVDTSGSISTWQFNHFMSEIKSILDAFPQFKGLFIDCDAQINQVVEIVPNEEFNPKMKGGGGTDFHPVFDYVKKESLNPRVLIYLTDGYGYFPDKEPDYPVIWLIDSEVEPPWGEKIQYEYDEADKEDF